MAGRISDIRIPQANQRVLKWIGGRRQQTLPGCGCREITSAIVRLKLGTSKRGVHGEPKMVACALQIQGDPTGFAQYGSFCRGATGSTADVRLKVEAAIVSIVEPAAWHPYKSSKQSHRSHRALTEVFHKHDARFLRLRIVGVDNRSTTRRYSQS